MVLAAGLGALTGHPVAHVVGDTDAAAKLSFVAGGYPSDHMLYATSVFGMFAVLGRRHGRPEVTFIAVALVLAMGVQRVASGAHLIDEVIGTAGQLAEKNKNRLIVDAQENVGALTADSMRLKQILLNLLTNAIKFTHNGGSVEVTAYSIAGIFQLRVKDTGVGVRLLDIDRVFEPFVQIDRHLTSDTQQGVGLGLPISRELARAMHGDLTLQSIEGVGSTFTLTLPIASDISATSAERPAADASPLRAALAS